MGTKKPALERAVYNIPEVASLLSINLPRAYELAKTEDFPAIRIGRRIVVPKAGLEKWLDRQSGGTAGNQ